MVRQKARLLDLQLTLIWDSLWNNGEQTWIKKRKCKNETEYISHCNNPHCIHNWKLHVILLPVFKRDTVELAKIHWKLIQMSKDMGCIFMKPFDRQGKTFQSEREVAKGRCISDL